MTKAYNDRDKASEFEDDLLKVDPDLTDHLKNLYHPNKTSLSTFKSHYLRSCLMFNGSKL